MGDTLAGRLILAIRQPSRALHHATTRLHGILLRLHYRGQRVSLRAARRSGAAGWREPTDRESNAFRDATASPSGIVPQ